MGCRISGNRDGYVGSIDTALGYRYYDTVLSVVLHSFSTVISGAIYMKPFKNVEVGATIDLPLEKDKPEIAFGCSMVPMKHAEMRLKVNSEGVLSAYFKKCLTPDMVIAGTASVGDSSSCSSVGSNESYCL